MTYPDLPVDPIFPLSRDTRKPTTLVKRFVMVTMAHLSIVQVGHDPEPKTKSNVPVTAPACRALRSARYIFTCSHAIACCAASGMSTSGFDHWSGVTTCVIDGR